MDKDDKKNRLVDSDGIILNGKGKIKLFSRIHNGILK
jgi:hypothetical protein